MTRLRNLPLRLTLVAALLFLVALGLMASGVAVTSALSNSLIQRQDQSLIDAVRTFGQPRGPDDNAPQNRNERLPPSDFYVLSKDTSGATKFELMPTNSTVRPDLTGVSSATPTTVGSVDGSSTRWRVISVQNDVGVTDVAIRLTQTDLTVDKLIVLQLIIGAIVLLVLAVAAYFVVRQSLRPLVQVEETAAAIAAGDLHRRVPERSAKTEVGRLSSALNGMLAQIQAAFAASAASEDAARASEEGARASAEAARASEEKMRRFIADASHELRTPLTTIRGFSELYRQGAMSDIKLLMNRIEGESARMGLLVDDLLMLARLDAQRPIESKPVDVLRIAADAVQDAKAVAPKRTIKFKMLPGPGIPEVLGDDARLRQVLGNLVGNAIRHTPESAEVTVCVGTTESDVLLEVRDTGLGLEEEEAQHIFERFYRADSSRTRESGGSGLGLSIVAALVAAHNGTVSVDSRPEAGATFRVVLPRVL